MTSQTMTDHGSELAAKASLWMAENPKAMALFEQFALELAAKGRRFGLKLLAERVRWEIAVQTSGDDFRINNNYVAYIARDLVRRHPKLADLVELRQAKGAA